MNPCKFALIFTMNYDYDLMNDLCMFYNHDRLCLGCFQVKYQL